MPSTIPQDFSDINTATARSNSNVNLMGVITDFMNPIRTRGTDWMCSFSISDPSYQGLDDGLKIRFFRPSQNDMPAIGSTGDVIILRCIKITQWSGMTIGLSSRATTWAVFPTTSIPESIPSSPVQLKCSKDSRAPGPSPAEMQYAITLCNSRDRSTFTDSVAISSSGVVTSLPNGSPPRSQATRDKFALIKDIQVETYHDLVGQVIRIYPGTHGLVELYLTDYTSNTLLWNYEWGDGDRDQSDGEGEPSRYTPYTSSTKKWPGPFGKMTLTVTLWQPHSYFCRSEVKENDFVHLRNVHVKWSNDSKVEGVLHSDRRYPDRVDISILKNKEDDERVKDILRRKRDYAKRFENQSKKFITEARGLKRKEAEGEKSLSKNQRKKKRKQEQEQAAKSKDQAKKDENGKENERETRESLAIDHSTPSNKEIKSQKQIYNDNVRCSHHLNKPRSLASILSLENHANTTPQGTTYTLPFQNMNCRANVRVIDFFPPDLADFAVPCPKPSEYSILSDAESSDKSEISSSGASNQGDEHDSKWEWRFALTLEDALPGPKTEEKAAMEAYVAGQDAEGLLKLDAEDLRKSPQALATLREKLFILWGDLEERKAQKSLPVKSPDTNAKAVAKDDTPKNKPFQCCLKEYGIKKQIPKSTENKNSENESEGDGDDEDDDGDRDEEGQPNPRGSGKWVWERRWRMHGCTIV